ncbi:type VI secretion system protein TssL, short form [Edwardsiella piscicida]|uniref:type VI secretion system protein TssL, short form n=1 Tax=Edwardsiella piscicida TaxID=1263550 RepID=UPI0002C07741|nr:type VI secretion system protein TssL, short form [Edwardsiella piscicida]AGH74007.1 type VI secretion system protein ImpK [Edwardsiella piscicida C07-087]AOP43285.1 type VI secretion system protein TssL, short form [Edwardsiella piscicida]EKS7765885.1 type VI secretion system protein TssL, short form [Edwardsiella piscicida]EKS7780383.1 type VI secretion system protein TssL, short form [Edwardsiella piscicida]EKS7783424.1 type VI secretion system protein TssL, short form [Edwardsiella pisc
MNRPGISQIEQIFYPGWLMASQLRGGQEVRDGEGLYRRACRLVQEARTALAEAGYSDISRDHMVYALCALLDESVLNRGTLDDGYLNWRRDPLQAHFFGTLNAGEELWERIRNLLKASAPDTAVLTCMYRTLQLGFVGQYRAQDDERREDVVRALGERVPAFTVAQDAPMVIRASHLRSGRRLFWISWIIGAAALAALWCILSSSLTDLVGQTIRLG